MFQLQTAWQDQVQSYAVTGCERKTKYIVVPANIDGKSVTEFSVEPLDWYPAAEQIQLPNSIKRISDSAFDAFPNLKEILIPLTREFRTVQGILYSSKMDTLRRVPQAHPAETLTLEESIKVIQPDALSGCCHLREVQLPKQLESIGTRAFQWCSSLEEIQLPDSVHTLREYAFLDCSSLRKVKLSAGMKAIQYNTFSKCSSLEQVEIPEGLEAVWAESFSECTALKELKLPDTMQLFAPSAAAGCVNLERILVSDSNPYFKTIDGVLYTRDLKHCILCPENGPEKVVLPEETATVSFRAFRNCRNLREIQLPKGVHSLDASIFQGCAHLEEIHQPGKVKYLPALKTSA